MNTNQVEGRAASSAEEQGPFLRFRPEAGLPNIRPQILPETVLKKLTESRGRYTDIITVFHAVCLATDHWVGVAGDGSNGAYEWFSFGPEWFEMSDCGYGDTVVALRDVLNLKVK